MFKTAFQRSTGFLKSLFHRQGGLEEEAFTYSPLREITAEPLAAPDDKKRIVNYLWANPFKFNADEQDALCGVPMNYIDKAIENAMRYPDARFIVWIDKNHMDQISSYFAASHLYIRGTSNIELRDLNEIKRYQDLETFNMTSSGFRQVWARADLARLLAMEYCLDTLEADETFYSDFDVGDIAIYSEEALMAIEKNGLVFGATIHGRLENGYFGFSKSEPTKFLSDLINKTIDDAYRGDNGYCALKSAVIDWEKSHDYYIDIDTVKLHVLEPCGFRIDDEKFYFETGLNPDICYNRC